MKKLWTKFTNWVGLNNKKMIEEFDNRYPDKCFICSIYRYGRDNMGDRSLPPEHDCVEKRKKL